MFHSHFFFSFDFNNEINTVNGIDVKVKFSGEDRLEARTVLKDINGDETAELEIEMTREVRMTGKKGIESMLYSLVAAGLTFIIILWLFLEKNVISRILNLSRDVVRAGDGNFSNASFSHERTMKSQLYLKKSAACLKGENRLRRS